MNTSSKHFRTFIVGLAVLGLVVPQFAVAAAPKHAASHSSHSAARAPKTTKAQSSAANHSASAIKANAAQSVNGPTANATSTVPASLGAASASRLGVFAPAAAGSAAQTVRSQDAANLIASPISGPVAGVIAPANATKGVPTTVAAQAHIVSHATDNAAQGTLTLGSSQIGTNPPVPGMTLAGGFRGAFLPPGVDQQAHAVSHVAQEQAQTAAEISKATQFKPGVVRTTPARSAVNSLPRPTYTRGLIGDIGGWFSGAANTVGNAAAGLGGLVEGLFGPAAVAGDLYGIIQGIVGGKPYGTANSPSVPLPPRGYVNTYFHANHQSAPSQTFAAAGYENSIVGQTFFTPGTVPTISKRVAYPTNLEKSVKFHPANESTLSKAIEYEPNRFDGQFILTKPGIHDNGAGPLANQAEPVIR